MDGKAKSWGRHLLRVAGIIALAAAMYAPSLSSSFIWDDNTLIAENPALRMRSPVWLLFQSFWPPTQTTSLPAYYRPATVFWFWLGYRLWGARAILFRLFNLFAFCVVVVLVYFLAMRLLGEGFGATLAAAFFALNPVHTESVALVAGLTDVSAAAFLIAALLLFASRKPLLRWGLAPVAFLLAMMSKETAVPGILLFPIYAIFFEKKGFVWAFLSLLVFFLPTAAYFALRHYVLGVWGAYAIRTVGLAQALLTIPYLIIRYIQNVLFPLTLSPLHAEWYGMFSPLVWLAWVLPLAAIALAAARFGRGRVFWFCVCGFFLFLLPALRLVPHQGALWADRFAFLPSVFASVVVGRWLVRLWNIRLRGAPRLGRIAVLAYLAAMWSLGFTYSFWWRNDWTGFARLVRDAPENPEGYTGLAGEFLSVGEVDSAFFYAQLALEKDSLYPNALGVAASAALAKGDFAMAKRYSTRLIELDSGFVSAYPVAAFALLALGDTGGAVGFCERAQRIAPFSPYVNYRCGELYWACHDTARALDCFGRAAALLPDNGRLRARYRRALESARGRKWSNTPQ